uniref:Barrier to autointegration factor n=1 Tax=Panagrellus redivivus TaxID=6233 RepID=A0A7E4V5H6_PANRE
MRYIAHLYSCVIPFEVLKESSSVRSSTMSTSFKHREFTSEPMGDKKVSDIAGIGNVYGSKLTERGFGNASNLMGQFLIMNKDKDAFASWLKSEIGVSSRYSRNAAACLDEYSAQFM